MDVLRNYVSGHFLPKSRIPDIIYLLEGLPMWNLHQFCSEMKGLKFTVFTSTIIFYSIDAAVIENTQLPSQKGNANRVSSLSIMNSNVCESVRKDETKHCACKKENASI
jgi:hypothetical protein